MRRVTQGCKVRSLIFQREISLQNEKEEKEEMLG